MELDAEVDISPDLDETQRDTIKQWKKYSAELMVYCEELLDYGVGAESEPKQPKISLDTVLNDTSKITKGLTGEKLHLYLLQYIVEDNSERISWPQQATVLKDITQHLRRGFHYLRQQNSSSLCAAIDYGHWLNVAYDMHEHERIAGTIKGTWKKWLEVNVGIKDSYARKLRAVATILHSYPQFKKLCLTFSEVYTRRHNIYDMLQENSSVTEYWTSRTPAYFTGRPLERQALSN